MVIQLKLTKSQEQLIEAIAKQFNSELERPEAPFPNATTLQKLKVILQETLFSQAGFEEHWEVAKNSQNVTPICIIHSKPIIRNLPWQLVIEEHTELPLFKAIKPNLPSYKPSLGGPLKILFMIATPTGETRLHFEEEEKKLMIALLPLINSGLVDIHFTNNGSIEDLKEKLYENKFHILHFSGHGSYINGKGTLALEMPLLGVLKETDISVLNDLFNRLVEKGNLPTLMVFSACKTAQGETGELSGVADALIYGNIPAVIAMASSVLDDCATHFTTILYDLLSQGLALPSAFQIATKAMRTFEVQRYQPAKKFLADDQILASGQWLIPQLLMNQRVEQLVDKNADRSELTFTSDANYLKKEKNLISFHKRHYNYVFAGRRKEIQLVFQAIDNNKIVLLRGQGGVGKTALAEHLAIRFMARNSYAKVFLYSDRSPSADSLLKQLQEYLTEEKQQFNLVSELAIIEKLTDKFQYLLKVVSDHCDPIFIFDNVESLQTYDKGNAAWVWNMNQHEDVLTLLQVLHKNPVFPVIVTGRYPVAEFTGWQVCDLNTVPFGDFLKKCRQLSFSELPTYLPNTSASRGSNQEVKPKGNFQQVIQLLYDTLGGNFRALEFFNELYDREKAGIFEILDELDALREGHKMQDEVLHRMSENLVFEQLLTYLNDEDKDTLYILANFRIPVFPMALGMQRQAEDRNKPLSNLVSLTLVELQVGLDGRNRYYVTSLIKELLQKKGFPEALFSASKAGEYHELVTKEKITLDKISELAESFEWYYNAKDIQGSNRVGVSLCIFYFEIQQFQLALNYGLRTEEISKKQTHARIWNILGIVFRFLGKLDQALYYNQLALTYSKSVRNMGDEGMILNNIGQIYSVKGENETAIEYQKEALLIQQKINNRSGEGLILSNLGLNYRQIEDYDSALNCYQQALKIQEEIGDLLGKGRTLNNISIIYSMQGKHDSSLQYLQKSLIIRKEIGDLEGEANTLNNLGKLAYEMGEYDNALNYYQQALKVFQEIGTLSDRAYTIDNIAELAYHNNDYNTALNYFQQALKVYREIGNRNREAVALSNISSVYLNLQDYTTSIKYCQNALKIYQELEKRKEEGRALQDLGTTFIYKGDFDDAMNYSQQALRIQKEIDDREGEGITINNVGLIYMRLGDYSQALHYLEQSLKIQEEISNFEGMALPLLNIGAVLLEQAQYEEAVAYFFSSFQIFKNTGSPRAEIALNCLNTVAEKIGEAKVVQMIEQLSQN